MKFTAYVFQKLELPEPVPASEVFPEMDLPPNWHVAAVPVLVEELRAVTFTFDDFEGEIGLPDGSILHLRCIADEPVTVHPEGLLMDESVRFVDGPWAAGPDSELSPWGWVVMFEFPS